MKLYEVGQTEEKQLDKKYEDNISLVKDKLYRIDGTSPILLPTIFF